MGGKPGGNKNAKHRYSPAEAAAYLRRLADQLESGSISLGAEEMEFEQEIKVKESLKPKDSGDKVKFQLKVSLHPHSIEQAPVAKPASRAKKTAAPPKAAPARKPAPAGQPEAQPAAKPKKTAAPVKKAAAPRKAGPAKKAPARKSAAPKKAAPAKSALAEKKAEGPASYKELKKRLSAGFKALRTALRDGRAPEKATARDFCDDCRLITTFPGKGDPAYQGFQALVEDLAAALEAGDPATVKRAFDQISEAKNSCHKQFK